jgi:hypothetical protein
MGNNSLSPQQKSNVLPHINHLDNYHGNNSSSPQNIGLKKAHSPIRKVSPPKNSYLLKQQKSPQKVKQWIWSTCVNENLVASGCDDGIIRLYNSKK